MARRHYVVILDEGWQIALLDRGRCELGERHGCGRQEMFSSAEEIWKSLRDLQYTNEPLLVALGSSSCVTATLPLPTTRHARQRMAMTYLLEPHLPWAAEDVVVDYQVHGSRSFMVATEAAPLRAFVDQLEELGARVEYVTPLASLALSRHLMERPNYARKYALVWGERATAETWLIDDDQPSEWRWLSLETQPIKLAIEEISLCEGGSLPLLVQGVPDEIHAELTAIESVDDQPSGEQQAEELSHCAVQEALDVLLGRRLPAIDFRPGLSASADRHRPIRRHLAVVQVLTCLLMGAVGAALFLQAEKYDSQRRLFADQQQEEFRQVFPEQRVPVGVRSRLEGELARLKGVRGERTDLPDVTEAVAVLERLLTALPQDLRFRLLEIRVEGGRLYLVGQVRSHSDSDRIAAALRSVGFEVASPNTHQLRTKGVEFRTSAQLKIDDAETAT